MILFTSNQYLVQDQISKLNLAEAPEIQVIGKCLKHAQINLEEYKKTPLQKLQKLRKFNLLINISIYFRFSMPEF